ncbi:MAG: hypothetical protein RLZZ440_2857 [Planctomycetota bacterium]
MAAANDDSRSSSRGPRKKAAARERITLTRRDTADGAAWELVQPRCARRRREDLEEVEAMMAAGEVEIARDELIWLLSECPDFLEAHVSLGLIALEEGDPKLARGHFGRPYELCLRAIDAAGSPRPVPHSLAGNRPFFEAAKGLVHCLLETGRRQMAADVGRRLSELDPADPLGIQQLLKRKP